MKLSPLDPFAFQHSDGRWRVRLACSGRLADAVAIARDVTKRHPDVTWANRQLAAYAGMAGDLETARSAARKLLAANPDFYDPALFGDPWVSGQSRVPRTDGARAAGRRPTRGLKDQT